MPRQPLRFVRGTAAQLAAYTGPSSEPAFASDTGRLVVADGATPGGIPQVSVASLFTDLGVVRPSAKPTLGDVINKMVSGTGVTIAFEGDSLTYGQDTTATGTRPALQAGLTRSTRSIPEGLQAQLGSFGYPGAAAFVNRGYPGDSTAQGLTRWASAAFADLVFVMYGHNDCLNYGGNGVVPIAQYRANLRQIIERRLSQGSAVVILEPPPVKDRSADYRLRAYVTAARQVAREYGLPFVPTRSAVRQIVGSIWSDGVHLSAIAYNRIGGSLAALFATRDEDPAHVGPGSVLYTQNGMGPGGSIFTSAAARTGEFYVVTPGQVLSIPFYADVPVVPVVTTCNTTVGTDRHLRAYYETSNSGIPLTEMANDGTNNPRRSCPLPMLERGFHTIDLANQGSVDVYIESIRFEAPGLRIQASTAQISRCSLSGSKRPQTGVGTGWWGAVDHGRRLNPGHTISAMLRLAPGNENGISLVSDLDISQAYISNNQIMIVRYGTSLIIRELVNGNVTDTTTANVFPAAEQIADLEVTNDGSTLTVYVDGVQKAQKSNPAFSSGYPAILSNGVTRLACLAISISD